MYHFGFEADEKLTTGEMQLSRIKFRPLFLPLNGKLHQLFK